MCGIVAIYDKSGKNNARKVKKMLKTMRHRGPDGMKVYHHGAVSLGITRLAMVTPQAKPTIFSNETTDIFCVFNGEIYNYKKLRDDLIKKGHIFKTDSDGEVIVHLYEQYGKKFVQYLDGMFAIALYTNEQLLLVTDSCGIKPLYYTAQDNLVLFSSELRPILKLYPKHHISQQGLASYLQYRFVAYPFTIFCDIYKFGPREIKTVSADGIKNEQYKLNAHKNRSLRQNFISDLKNYESDEIEIGTFLSGGLDSSIINSALSKSCHAFTIQYTNAPKINETNYAGIVAKQKKLTHHIETLSASKLPTILKKTAISLEEPLYSTVAPCTYFLAFRAKRYVKGVICGDGADEMFIGYNYIRTALNNKGTELETYKQQISWLTPQNVAKLFYAKPQKMHLIQANSKPLDTIMEFERTYRLSCYHLFRLDKLTMAHSIEGRVPFLSHSILNYISRKSNTELLTTPAKQDLIKAFKNILPKEILSRKKQPFTAPFIEWQESCLQRDMIKTFKNKKLCCLFNINSDNLLALSLSKSKDYSDYTALWGIYMLLLWAKHYNKNILT